MAGERIYKDTANTGGYIGWVCTGSGSVFTSDRENSWAYGYKGYQAMFSDSSVWVVTTEGTTASSEPTTELATDGDFASDTRWSTGGGWTIGSGVATCDGTAGNSYLRQSPLLLPAAVIGGVYEYSVDIDTYNSGTLYITVGGVNSAALTSTGTKTGSITATTTGEAVRLAGVDFDGVIDNVSITSIANAEINDFATDGTVIWLKVGDDIGDHKQFGKIE